MDYLNEEEKIRGAEIYEEIKDLSNLRKIFNLKKEVFAQRRFKLRALVLGNLKKLIEMQLKALDEEYNLIGLDEECWLDEEHFLHDLQYKIEKSNENVHSKEQKERIINKVLELESKEEKQIDLLLVLIKQYMVLLYNELNKAYLENIFEINKLILQEDKKIDEIGKIITLEEKEEREIRKGI